jgi:tetratricopeptide (TPR) repeat protein
MEYEEIRGYHLEQAFLIRAQLGPLDDRTVAVGRRAAGYLEAAGRRTLARGDMPAAATLLQRAAALLPADGGARVRTQLLAGEALAEVGELAAAEAILGAAAAGASSLGDRGLAAAAIGRLLLAYTTHPEASGAAAVEEARRLVPVLEEVGDQAGLARAWRLLTLIHFYEARYQEAEHAARRMIEHPRRAGDEVMARRVLPTLSQCAVYGPTPVQAAIARCERILSGYVELLAGDPGAAERELRGDHEALEVMGERNCISTTEAFLAEALYQQGRLDEADRFTRMSEEVAAPGRRLVPVPVAVRPGEGARAPGVVRRGRTAGPRGSRDRADLGRTGLPGHGADGPLGGPAPRRAGGGGRRGRGRGPRPVRAEWEHGLRGQGPGGDRPRTVPAAGRAGTGAGLAGGATGPFPGGPASA